VRRICLTQPNRDEANASRDCLAGGCDARCRAGQCRGALFDQGSRHVGGSTSLAGGINASGWVAGASSLAGDTAQHAFLYDGSSMFDLNSLIDPRSNWSITDATGINDAGQIAGWSGDLYSGVGHALFLTPLSTSAVPEPAAWAMMIVGFGMIGGLARRKPISGAPSNT